jgi:alpha-1,4-galacturonosyltransferase
MTVAFSLGFTGEEDLQYNGSAGSSHQHAPEKRISKGSAGVVDQHKQIDSHSTSGVAKQKGTSHKAERANTIAANAMRASFQL